MLSKDVLTWCMVLGYKFGNEKDLVIVCSHQKKSYFVWLPEKLKFLFPTIFLMGHFGQDLIILPSSTWAYFMTRTEFKTCFYQNLS